MKNLMTKLSYALFILLSIILFTGCADVTVVDDCISIDTYGFWGGLWHGMIAPFSWIGSLLSDDIALYAVSNNGGWYDLGVVLGIGALSIGSTKASS